jgi:hypothetical protein
LPQNGIVPRAARSEWVKIIVKCHLGNGMGYREGVDETADHYYRGYIRSFGEADIGQFLRLFADPDFTIDFDSSKVHRRAMGFAKWCVSVSKNTYILRALEAILAQPEGHLRKMTYLAKFNDAVANLPAQI